MEQQASRGMVYAEQPATWPAEPEDISIRVRRARQRAREHLLALQREDGHWCAELEGDTILESEYALCMHYLGPAYRERARKAANFLRQRQGEDGGWALYPGGPADVSASVKAYFVLKLTGEDADSAPMRRARQRILELGGLDACNSYTKLYLSIFGQYDWERAPAVPPELVLLPRWFPFNLYEMSSWSRAIVVPLSVMWALRPSCRTPDGLGIGELRAPGGQPSHPAVANLRGRLWAGLFSAVDRFIHVAERNHLFPFLRRRALRRAEEWMRARLPKSDGIAAIFPPIINTIYALDVLGYAHDHPLFASQLAELQKLEIEEGDTLRVQPCFSPVWDTCQVLAALAEDDDLPNDDPRLAAAVEWLLDHEVREAGDWRVKNPDGPIGGWYFEYANEFYPDCDDTAEILLVLPELRLPRELRQRTDAAAGRALAWLLSMQNRDGGWASFDKGCDKEFLTYIPFADHNAMIDPSTSDVTARALEALARHGHPADSPPLAAGMAFLRRQQEPDGSWYGRWGCNYLYGTWLAVQGLAAAGADPAEEWGRRAVEWLRGCQNEDGGWGELPASYDDPALKGQGPSTAAQTAWALMALFAAGDRDSEGVERGIEYLLSTQLADGGWRDEPWTGTGFPSVFYLNYHYYALYFPLLALIRYEREPAAKNRSHRGAA